MDDTVTYTELTQSEKDVRRYQKNYEKHLTDTARCIAFWLAAHEATGVELPYYPTQTYQNITQYDVAKPGQPIDADETNKLFAKLIKWAHAKGYTIKKDYKGSEFNVYIQVKHGPEKYDYDSYNVYAPREITCTPKIVGKKTIAAKPAEAPKQVDIIEWDCTKISFLGIDTD